MSSFSENKTEKLMEKGLSAQWVDYNRVDAAYTRWPARRFIKL